MKIFALALAAAAALSAVDAAEQASIHLRVHDKGGSCTITNESQCNGQNWTGSTCCADPSYECRWSDDGQNVQRCQKKKGSGTTGGGGSVADWGDCTGGKTCATSSSVCVKYSNYYSQCKPATLPAGELCGQNDGTNVWKYDHCPSNQQCSAMGKDFRCTNKKHHKKAKSARKDGSCTITNESQCNGQNWTGSTCCADPSYECRWSDDGQNVKRCQKINSSSPSTDYSGSYDSEDSNSDDFSEDYSDDVDYTSYADDWGDCTKNDVGCTNPSSICVYHSSSYAECKPNPLPSGEMCGQTDGTNDWYYPFCSSGESCETNGSESRCTKAKKRHHHHHHHHHRQHRRA